MTLVYLRARYRAILSLRAYVPVKFIFFEVYNQVLLIVVFIA